MAQQGCMAPGTPRPQDQQPGASFSHRICLVEAKWAAEVRSWRSGWLWVSQPTFLPQFPPMSPKFLCLFPRMQNFLLRMSSFALNSRFLKDILTGISWCTVACQGLRFPGERPRFSGNPPPTRERSEQEKCAWRTDQHPRRLSGTANAVSNPPPQELGAPWLVQPSFFNTVCLFVCF